MTDYCNTNGCLREFILGYFGEKQDKPCQNCSGCLGDFGETEEVDVSVDCQKCFPAFIDFTSETFLLEQVS